LSAIEPGDPHAAEQLLPLVYDELRQLAAQKLSQEQPGQTLQATALVHEAYLRLVQDPQREQGGAWDSRRHFFAAAAEAMRRILAPAEEILAVHEALEILESKDPRKAQLVKVRYFAGLSTPQATEVLGISLRTAERNWTYARTWLHRALATEQPASGKEGPPS
jgi:DNA-directed RNA polymerase specialized sigma24 family protein